MRHRTRLHMIAYHGVRVLLLLLVAVVLASWIKSCADLIQGN